MRQTSLVSPATSADGRLPCPLPELMEKLQKQGVQTVRVTYCDVHGIARGKELPLKMLRAAVEEGLGFCQANLTAPLTVSLVGLPDLPPSVLDPYFPDMLVRPLPATLVQLPWEPTVGWCLADIDPGDPAHGRSVRGLLQRVLAEYAALELRPVCAPELEFYLLRRDSAGGVVRANGEPGMVYTMGECSDPAGVVRELLRHGTEMGLGVTTAHHECGAGQYEINLQHGDALDAADRAFRFKHMAKEVACRRGLLATFMGKPFADDAGSGFHLHVSHDDASGNAFFDARASDGLTKLARHFVAGVLEHAPALMALYAPTVNSYKRMVPGVLVPMTADWGYDNRTTYIRVPPQRGQGTRLELRAADAAANPYLVVAASLFAGLDGIRRELTPPQPVDDHRKACHAHERPLPRRLEDSLIALQADSCLVEALGQSFVSAFCALKLAEAERYSRHVSPWEVQEYAWHL